MGVGAAPYATQRRRFPDFVELDIHLQPHVERRAAGPGGAGSSAGFDPNVLVLPVSCDNSADLSVTRYDDVTTCRETPSIIPIGTEQHTLLVCLGRLIRRK